MSSNTSNAKPRLTDTCPDCRIPFADCLHREARLGVIARWEALQIDKPPADSALPQPDSPLEKTPTGPMPFEERLIKWPQLKEPPRLWRSDTHRGEITFEVSGGEGRYHTLAYPREDLKSKQSKGLKRLPFMHSALEGLLKVLAEKLVGFQLTGADAVANACANEMPEPPKKTPQSQDAKPVRRAWSLPKTADGDTLLILPTERDVPPGLLNEKRWLIWKARWDSSKEKFNKLPVSPLTGKQIGATEKYLSDFTTFAKAHAAAEKFNASGLGFVFLRGDKRIAIDFDHCIKTVSEEHNVPGGHVKSSSPAIDSEVWPWLDKWFSNSYQEVSPSGDGIHIVCLGELPGSKAVTKTELPKADGVSLELYDHDRFLTFTGQRLGVILKDVTDCGVAITKLLTHVRAEKPLSSGGELTGQQHPISKLTARKLHEQNIEALRNAPEGGGNGNALLNSTAFFASKCFYAGVFDEEVTEESIKADLLHIVTKIWSSPHPESGARETTRSGWDSGKAEPLTLIEDEWPQIAATLEEFNDKKKFFAVRNFGGKFRVCHFDHVVLPREGRLDVRRVIVPQTRNDFYNGYCNQLIKVGEKKDGTPELKDKASVWLNHRHRKEYEKVVFKPGTPEEPGELNLWDGFNFPPIKGDCSLYLAHLRDNVCQGNDSEYNWLISWMAWQVRHPGDVGQSAIVIHGLKGVGKNVAAEGFCELWGQHGLVVTSDARVTSNFNSHLRDKCVLVADEAFFAGDPRQVRQLKGLITGGTLQIEAKGVDTVTVPNLLRLIIIGNDAHIVNATGDERRFFVLECGNTHCVDTKYFAALNQQLNHGGYSALLFHLLEEVDLANFDVRNPPHTAELRSQMARSTSGAEDVVRECLATGEIPGYLESDGTVLVNLNDLTAWANRRRPVEWGRIKFQGFRDVLGNRGLGLGPDQMREKLAGKSQPRRWSIPSLRACRQLWDQKFFPVEWPDDDGKWGETYDKNAGL